MKTSFFRRIACWIDERLPLNAFWSWFLHEEIPGGASFSYSLGSASLFLLFLLFFTGIWELFVYVPTVDHAYASLSYFRLNIPFGWLAHGLHYWSAMALSIIVVLHMLRTFIWGAYKKPREMTWLAGVLLLLLTTAFMFTGPILAWDKKGYWAGRVGMEMVGTVPIIGTFLQSVIWGSASFGQLALSRMFVFHVAILPILMAAMFAIHIIAFRIQGSSGAWDPVKQKIRGGLLWPDQIFKNAAVLFFLFLLLIGLVVFTPPPFYGMADSLDSTYIPKPEWIFLSVYQLLKYFPGRWEPVVVVGAPFILILLLLSLPFLDGNKERAPSKRLFVLSCGFLLVISFVVLTILGFLSSPSQNISIPPSSNISIAFPDDLNNEKGGEKKVSNSQNRTEANQPQTVDSTYGEAVYVIGNHKNGKTLYENNCLICHGPQGRTESVGIPSLNPIHDQLFDSDAQKFAQKIDMVIQHGSPNAQKGLIMPAFGDKGILTQQQIADVEAYILQVNGVNRGMLNHPGILPKTFFVVVLAVVVCFLILALFLMRAREKNLHK